MCRGCYQRKMVSRGGRSLRAWVGGAREGAREAVLLGAQLVAEHLGTAGGQRARWAPPPSARATRGAKFGGGLEAVGRLELEGARSGSRASAPAGRRCGPLLGSRSDQRRRSADRRRSRPCRSPRRSRRGASTAPPRRDPSGVDASAARLLGGHEADVPLDRAALGLRDALLGLHDSEVEDLHLAALARSSRSRA